MISNDIEYQRTSKNQILRLFRIDKGTLQKWIKRGFPVERDGSIFIVKAVRWWRRQYELELYKKLESETLSQEELGRLLDVSRQTLYAWGRREGLPRNKDGTYNLSSVCAWLPHYYRRIYGRRFKKTFRALQSAFTRIIAWTEKESEV